MLKESKRRVSGIGLFLSFFAVATLTVFWAGCKRGDSEKTPGKAQATDQGDKSQAGLAMPGPKFDTGRAVLEQMAKAYRNAKSYSDMGMVRLMAESGQRKLDQKVNFSVAYQSPNKLRMEVYQSKLVIDGKKFYAAIDDLPGQVLEKDAPAALTMQSVYGDRILMAAAINGFAGAAPQVLLLCDDKAIDVLLRDADEPKLAEPGEIDGRPCYQVQLRRVDGLGILWIDKETLVLRRMVLPTDEIRRALTQETGAQVDALSLVADFSGAQLNGSVPTQAFQFQVPAEAQRVSYFIPPHPGQLLTKKAPEFRFFDLEGKPVSLQSLAGKVAVVDFWATWCGPCKISLPNLEKVYEKYKNNDKVAFLAVSLDEPQVEDKALTDLFKELKVSVPIFRDREKIASGFKFSGIPITFIIDAKGIVQDFQAGGNPELTASIPEKIEKLLAGENISDEPMKRYQDELKEYEKFISTNQADESGAKATEQAIPQAKIADRSEPRTLKLTSLWKCTDLKSPGNILVFNSPKSPQRLLVVDNLKSVAEVGLDGKVAAVHELKIGDVEIVSNIRAFTAADGKKYYVVFASDQQRCHVLDEQWNLVLSYPADALEHPHSGIADVQLGDLDGDGVPEMYVGYWGVVGVQAVSLEGKRIWSNRSISNVVRMAFTEPDSGGRRDLLCTNNNGVLTELDAKGQRKLEIVVPNRMVYWIVGGDLQGNGQLQWCGLAAPKLGESIALGLNLKGEELWNFALPAGVQQHPIEPIIAGKITRDGPGQWILPGADGSINFISADGKLLDGFNYGAVLQGLTTVSIDGQPALLVATPNGLEALKVE